jgi:hypothetical protein
MRTILVQNNVLFALNEMENADKILFAPLYSSSLQLQFHLKRFE